MSAVAPGAPADPDVPTSSFEVHLDVFTGPFDLLLGLIAKHRLDVTEVALAEVTDEFVAHIRAMGDDWDLDEVSGFVLVAATLLDLKASRLLPGAQVEDEQDLALLEARDLLFARLLQYRAFRTGRRRPRAAPRRLRRAAPPPPRRRPGRRRAAAGPAVDLRPGLVRPGRGGGAGPPAGAHGRPGAPARARGERGRAAARAARPAVRRGGRVVPAARRRRRRPARGRRALPRRPRAVPRGARVARAGRADGGAVRAAVASRGHRPHARPHHERRADRPAHADPDPDPDPEEHA